MMKKVIKIGIVPSRWRLMAGDMGGASLYGRIDQFRVVTRMIEQAFLHHGWIDILINNAGQAAAGTVAEVCRKVGSACIICLWHEKMLHPVKNLSRVWREPALDHRITNATG